jgi:hypothetical protein
LPASICLKKCDIWTITTKKELSKSCRKDVGEMSIVMGTLGYV